MSRSRTRAAALAIGLVALAGFGPSLASAQAAPRIREIRIRSENVFEDAETSLLARVADSLHGTTREEVIRRELLFSEGETLDPERIAETARNLRGLGFFRSVDIRVVPISDEEVDVVVTTRDAWTTELSGSLGRIGGRGKFGAALTEVNLLGFGKKVAVSFASNPDRTTKEILYGDPQFLGRGLSLDLLYASASDGDRRRFVLSRRFRSLDSPFAATVALEDATRETRVYDHGSEAARFGMETAFLELSAGRRLTLFSNRPVARLSAGYRREEAHFTLEEGDPSTLPEDRQFGFFFARLDLLDPDFVVERDVAFFSRDEDYDVGSALSFEVGYSAPLFGAQERIESALRLAHGVRIPNGFVLGLLTGRTRMRDSALENSLVEAEVFGVWKPGESSIHRLVANALFSWGDHLDKEVQLAADGATGLRGYRLHAFTGDRRLIVNLEDRVRLTGELFRLIQLGAAVFVDAGYAWPKGAALDLADLRADAGVGLRVGLPRASRHALFRIDLSYALRPDLLGRRGWLLSFSGSQAF